MTSIRCREVSKSFGDVVALTDVSVAFEPGMTALLGPNGAGKSTLMRLCCGLSPPDQGQVEVDGRDPRRDPAVLDAIGLVPQQEELLGALDARAFVRLAAELHGRSDADRRARDAIRTVELDPDDDRPLRTYSKGMRQRIKLAQALVHEPAVLVLDEPLNGLDPVQRTRTIGLFRQLAAEGRTVVVSSHVLDEVERFGSRIVLLVRGRVLAEGDFHDIRDALDDRPRELRVRASDPRGLGAALVAEGVADRVELTGPDTLLVGTTDVHGFRAAIAPLARQHGARLLEVMPLDESLESVFRDLLGGPA